MHPPLPPSLRTCFVGMFDVLGFKSLRDAKGTIGLHQQYIRGILPAIAHSAAGKGKTETVNGQQLYVPDFVESRVSFRVISDSVLFFTQDDTFDSFVSLVHSAFMLLQFGFSGGKAPFRGAIGWGDLIDDPAGIVLGSAIEDAYLGESTQAWAGAMLTEAARDFAETNNYLASFAAAYEAAAAGVADEAEKQLIRNGAKRLVRYRVPTQHNPKDGPVTYSQLDTYAINWTIRMFADASSKSFGPPPSQHAAKIAVNTQQFEDWARTQ